MVGKEKRLIQHNFKTTETEADKRANRDTVKPRIEEAMDVMKAVSPSSNLTIRMAGVSAIRSVVLIMGCSSSLCCSLQDGQQPVYHLP